MDLEFLKQTDVNHRSFWVREIEKLSGNFGADSARLQKEIQSEFQKKGRPAILRHLRLCGNIPECYPHDSSEEKLYSKYTDILIAESLNAIGIRSLVLTERADAADVESVAAEFSFVADAKAFRLSRTAKNAKDFKVQSMDGWKRGKPFAMLVAPVYQLPSRTSQIYQQAATRNVCILTFTHLAALVAFGMQAGNTGAADLLGNTFRAVERMNPSKRAESYWRDLNAEFLSSTDILKHWNQEKRACVDAISIAKEDALAFMANERECILRMSHQEAIQAVIKLSKIEEKTAQIKKVSDNGLLALH